MAQAISAPRRINVISSALPSWIPPAGQVGIVPVSNIFHAAPVNPCPDGSCVWTSGGNGNKPVLWAESGACDMPDFGIYGALGVHGGGHGDSKENSLYALVYDEICEWQRLIDPITDPIVGEIPSINTAEAWGEYIGFPNELGSNHSSGFPIFWPAAYGGGVKGSFVMPVASAIGRESVDTGKPHLVDLNDLGSRWQRIGDGTTTGPSGSIHGGCCFDPTRNGMWAHKRTAPGLLSFLDLQAGIWTGKTLTSYGGTTGTQSISALHYIPNHDIIVICILNASAVREIRYAQLGSTIASTTGWHTVILTGDVMPTAIANGGDFCPDNGKIYFIFGEDPFHTRLGDPDNIYEVTIPGTLSDQWTVAKIPYSGQAAAVSAWTAMGNRVRHGPFKRFSYATRLKGFTLVQGPTGSSLYNAIPDAERVLCFKPPGT